MTDDVAELIYRTLVHRSASTLNIATGDVHSFRSIAERSAAIAKAPATRRAFPDFRYTPLDEGFVKVWRETEV
jgi:nucleoside-diphosphate-sugar epimerase